MSKRRPQSKSVNVKEDSVETDSVESASATNLLDMILLVITGALFFSRWFLPTEAAVNGDTLWVSMFFLLALAVWGIQHWRQESSLMTWNWLDVSIGLLVFGHILSALLVIVSEGQKRAATNMLWEWVGIAATFFLLRQLFDNSESKQSLLKVALTMCVVLSGFGIYQHYVEYPSLRNQFLEIEKEIAETSPDDGPKWNQLQMKLAELGIPADEKKRGQLAQRILYSSEPFGFFGLANSFATIPMVGILLTLIVAISRTEVSKANKKLIRFSLYAVIGVTIVYCLLLTKSRTALIGTFIGLVFLLCLLFQITLIQNKKLLRFAIIGICVISLLTGIAIATGSFDLAVLTESSKSLKYRMEYWQASMGVIFESPIFGNGPGQFRQTYLKYKLPESSESILDPHNLVLDVWANGGLIALTGLILTFVFGFRYLFESDDRTSNSNSESHHKTEIAIGLTAFALAYLVPFIIGLGFDDRLILLALIWLGVHCSWNYLVAERISNSEFSMFGIVLFAAVSIHLLGAGGIAMPAITTIWLLGPSLAKSNTIKLPKYASFAIAVLSFLGATFLQYSALSPVLNTREQLQIALSATSESAQKIALRKASLDTFDPEPRLFKAQLAFGKWKNQKDDFGQFTEAILLLQEAKKKDPNNVQFLKTEGRWWLERFEITDALEDARKAKDVLLEASKLSPTDVLLLVDLAISLEAAGNPQLAAEISQNVLEINQTNQRLGHVDKVIDEDLVKKMSKLAGFEGNSNDN